MKKSNRWLNVALCAVLTAAVAGVTGCAAFVVGGAVGAGAMAYAKGDVRETIQAPLGSVAAAVDKVLAERKLTVKKTTIGAKEVEYAANAEGKNLSAIDESKQQTTVDCVALDAAATQVTVRAGAFGDEERGRELLADIKKALK